MSESRFAASAKSIMRQLPTTNVALVTYGIPGSGKSVLAQQFVDKGWYNSNMDQLREKHPEIPRRYQWDHAIGEIAAATAEGNNIIIDNAHIFNDQAARIGECLQEHSYLPYFLYLDVPLEVCLERNSLRQRRIPAYIIESYYLYALSPYDVLRKNTSYHGLYIITDDIVTDFLIQKKG